MKGCEESDESARNCAGDALRRKVSDESPDESLFRHNERDRECHLIVAHGALWERDYGEEDRSWAKHAHASHARLPFLSERHGSGPSVFVVKNRGGTSLMEIGSKLSGARIADDFMRVDGRRWSRRAVQPGQMVEARTV